MQLKILKTKKIIPSFIIISDISDVEIVIFLKYLFVETFDFSDVITVENSYKNIYK